MPMNLIIFYFGGLTFIVGGIIVIINLSGEMRYSRIPYPKDRNPALIGKLLVAGSTMTIVGIALMGVAAFLPH